MGQVGGGFGGPRFVEVGLVRRWSNQLRIPAVLAAVVALSATALVPAGIVLSGTTAAAQVHDPCPPTPFNDMVPERTWLSIENLTAPRCGIGPFDFTPPQWAAEFMTVVDTTPSAVVLDWAPGATDDGGPVSYVVMVDGWRTLKTSATSTSIGSLEPDTSYQFEVRAVDGAGNETAIGLQVVATTLMEDLVAPQWGSEADVRLGPTGATWAHLNWSPGAEDDQQLAGYEVVIDGAAVATTTGTAVTVSGLAELTAAEVEVVAVDEAGNRSSGNPTATISTGPLNRRPNIESAVVEITDTWKTVQLNRDFVDPVVVVGPVSEHDPDPGLAVVDNVTSDSFDIRFREWDYLDGIHGVEEVAYLVVERGRTDLLSGARIEAGTATTTAVFQTQTFATPFQVRPAVLSAVVSDTEPETVAPRINAVGAESFELAFHVQQGGNANRPSVGVNWVAWSQGDDASGQDGSIWETFDLTADENWRSVNFDNTYGDPCVLVEVRTGLAEAATVRHQSRAATDLQLRVAEEQAGDSETGLGNESLLGLTTDCDADPPTVDLSAPVWNGAAVVARAMTSEAMTLSWSPGATDDRGVSGYQVFIDGVEVPMATTTGQTVSGLLPDTTYEVTVAAIDHAGNRSADLGPIAVTTAPANSYTLSPYGWDGDVDFAPDRLPSAAAEAAYLDWRSGVDDPAANWRHPPSTIFAAIDATPNSHGTYSYARAGAYWIGSLVDALRTTGDLSIVDELVVRSGQLKANLADHDGRGYEYFQYEAPAAGVNTAFRLTDTNMLDEQLMAGNLARLAWALHRNRHLVAAAGPEADFWFDHLDRNWVPKWLMRSTHATERPYLPPSELGLGNAVGWTSPDNSDHNDTVFVWASPQRFNDEAGIVHTLPVRQIMHPYIASIYQYEVMARYYAETGRRSVLGSQRYGQEAAARTAYWLTKTSIEDDGSRDIPHLIRNGSGSSDTDSYVHHLALYATDLHWLGVPGFDSDADMEAYARIFYNPAAPNDDVYDAGDVTSMARYVDATGSRPFMMFFTSLWSRWDVTGELAALNDAVIIDNRSHSILGDSDQHHGAHYNGILSAELDPPP